MATGMSKLNRSEMPFTQTSRASVLTLNYADQGYLSLDSPDFEQSGDIKGQISHLSHPAEVLSCGEDGFTVRYLDPNSKAMIELINCRPVTLDGNNILHFETLNERRIQMSILDHFEKTEIMFNKVQEKVGARKFNHIVLVMGAGASIEVLPGGANLLHKMLTVKRPIEIEQFIEGVFKAELKDGLPYPSFNQVLNIIDIALEREEGFSAKYSLEQLRGLKKRLISELRQYMIDQAIDIEENSYTNLARSLKEYHKDGAQISIITLNYDLFLDSALKKEFGTAPLDYVLPFSLWDHSDKNSPIKEDISKNPISIIKLHGSLNWMICPTCFEPYSFSDADLSKSLSSRNCIKDHTELQEFLFPPTKERVEVHSHWIQLQGKADQLLRDADKVIFIGFSLSEDDAHFRFKLKKHLYRTENPVYIQVVGSPKGNFDLATSNLAYHYWQFFGPIDYRPIGFSPFAKNPF